MIFRKTIPTAIVLVSGIIVVLQYFIKSPVLTTATSTLTQWRSLVAAFALGLGVVNIVRVHGRNLQRDGIKNIYSIALFVTMLFTCFFGLVYGKTSAGYTWIFNNITAPTNAAILALLAFYIASAAARAFRAKNVDATILLICGVIVMWGRVPLGAKLIPAAPVAMDWILGVLNVGGQRGVTIAGAIGFIAVSLRIIAGLERHSYGAE